MGGGRSPQMVVHDSGPFLKTTFSSQKDILFPTESYAGAVRAYTFQCVAFVDCLGDELSVGCLNVSQVHIRVAVCLLLPVMDGRHQRRSERQEVEWVGERAHGDGNDDGR